MSYRSVSRGMVRTLRAIDREAKRQERARIAYEKAAQRQAMFEAAADAAREYDTMIAQLTGAHRVNFTRRAWRALASEPFPADPSYRSEREDAAKAAAGSYRPSWFAKTFRFEKKQREKLAAAVRRGKACDQEYFDDLVAEATRHKTEIEFARRLVDLDHAAVAEAVERYGQFSQLGFAIEGLSILFTDDKRIIAMVDGLDFEDMPDHSVTLLQSGKASIKSVSRSRVLELHRDNICSSAVRVALEFLSVLPIEVIEVVMHADLLDIATGHIESQPVLYLRTAAQAVSNLNLSRTEGTALVERLGGHFDWNKRDGFRPIGLGAFNVPTDRQIEN